MGVSINRALDTTETIFPVLSPPGGVFRRCSDQSRSSLLVAIDALANYLLAGECVPI
ncbi:hypothetical protein SPLC1_S200150 [Arthrospira platensis C1]|nr:hypothetical protein SPLC1_S200150 [Arthrospira platensis C1]